MSKIPPHRPTDTDDEWKARKRVTRQKVGGWVAGAVAIIGAIAAAGLSINVGGGKGQASANTLPDMSTYVTRQEFQQVRREDRVEYLDTMKDVRSDMKTMQADLSQIKTMLINEARNSRIRTEAASNP